MVLGGEDSTLSLLDDSGDAGEKLGDGESWYSGTTGSGVVESGSGHISLRSRSVN